MSEKNTSANDDSPLIFVEILKEKVWEGIASGNSLWFLGPRTAGHSNRLLCSSRLI